MEPIVFVVDEDCDTRCALGELLDDEGFQPVLFGASGDARAALMLGRPSLVLIEPYAPLASGRGLRWPRLVAPPRFEVPVIVFTGWNTRLISAGAEIPVIAKPDVEALLMSIHETLGFRSRSQWPARRPAAPVRRMLTSERAKQRYRRG